MTTTQNLITALQTRCAAVQAQIDQLSRCLVGHNRVVRTSPGLYLLRDGDTWRPTGIEYCSRWTPEDAETVAANVTDGAGRRGQVVLLHDALRQELADLGGLVARLQTAAL